jgi:carbonic anhydrase
MTVTDDFLKNNERYAAGFGKGELAMPRATHVAIIACMDARLDPARALGLEEGDAHVIRNAGGVVTDDAIRSLVISQRLLGTKEVILIHHTDCGMLTFADDDVKAQIEQDTGIRPPFALESFTDVDDDVCQSIAVRPGERPCPGVRLRRQDRKASRSDVAPGHASGQAISVAKQGEWQMPTMSRALPPRSSTALPGGPRLPRAESRRGGPAPASSPPDAPPRGPSIAPGP